MSAGCKQCPFCGEIDAEELNRVDQLEAENKRLRETLTEIQCLNARICDSKSFSQDLRRSARQVRGIARQALKGTEDE